MLPSNVRCLIDARKKQDVDVSVVAAAALRRAVALAYAVRLAEREGRRGECVGMWGRISWEICLHVSRMID